MINVSSPALGHDLHDIVAATLRQAAELRPLLDDRSVATLDGLVDATEADACRIAVVGQIKAGKSSLINVMIRRPQFLPADVNPWTAVVTSLHFGRHSEAGAVYQFFDEDDWEHLAAGGRLQEISQRMGLAIDAVALARQVQSMRDRAQQRLGQEFRQLLGQQHRFATPSAEVLERYVCVGDFDRDSASVRPGHSVGRFADITRSADLYFDLPPFAYPTVIIDTPGTNDPFLVRDQLSREALDRTDACIVVLNAQQALSSSDVGLLRLLRGMQKERLVVFVNRIDLLGDPKADGDAVLAHVRDKLALEFAGSDIPIIVGSAAWAEQALVSGTESAPHGESTAPAATPSPERRAELMRLSGLDDLNKALSQLIVRGPTLLRLRRNQNLMLDLVTAIDLAARDEIASVEQIISSASEEAAAAAARRKQMAKDLKRLEALPSAVGRLIEVGVNEIAQARERAVKRLDAALRGVVLRHATAARDDLLRRPFQRHEHAWQFNTPALRRDLENQFRAIYREAADQLQGLERKISTDAIEAIKELLPKDAAVAEQRPVNPVDPTPSISALGWEVALELDEQWQDWWRLWHGQRQRARKLEEILVNEFRPVVDALVETAANELRNYQTTVATRFSKLSGGLTAILRRRKALLEVDGTRASKPAALAQDYQTRRAELEERIHRTSQIATELKYLLRRGVAIEMPPARPPAD